MIETSKDLLFVTLAFCVIWLTVFLCWLLYYLMAAVRDAEIIMRRVREAVETIDHLAHVVHDKVERSAASFTLAAQAAKEIIGWAMAQRRAASEEPRPRRRKKAEAEDEE